MRYVNNRRLQQIKAEARKLIRAHPSWTNADIANELIRSLASGYSRSPKGRKALKTIIAKERADVYSDRRVYYKEKTQKSIYHRIIHFIRNAIN